MALFAVIAFLMALMTTGKEAHAASVGKSGAKTAPTNSADYLLFCNNPERLESGGVYAATQLKGGKTYRIFFHYRNVGIATRPLVVAVHDPSGKPFTVQVRKGIADPGNDPPLAGRQAMARYLNSPMHPLTASKGFARLPMTLSRWEVGSGVLDVKPDRDVKLTIYFGHKKWTVPGAHVAAIAAPSRDITVALSDKQTSQYVRIGQPEAGAPALMDGMYGLFYNFHIEAPAGRKVRVVFSPRGGKSGLVGTFAGLFYESPIVDAAKWAVFGEADISAAGLVLSTVPFGGVFYPVEVAFHLL